MKTKTLLAIIIFALIGCQDDSPKKNKVRISVIQKGPFLEGSAVTIIPLREDGEEYLRVEAKNNSNTHANMVIAALFGIAYAQIDSDNPICPISTETIDRYGNFFGCETYADYVKITAEGYFFNETTNTNSDDIIHLTSYSEISQSPSLVVNLLTTLTVPRIQKLMSGGYLVRQAKIIAETELHAVFGGEGQTDPFDTMNISKANGGLLLAVSSIFLHENNAANLKILIDTFCHDFLDDGIINNPLFFSLKSDLKAAAQALVTSDIQNNVSTFYGAKNEPNDMETYVDFVKAW